jgi:phosphate:Na+ symporter
MYAMFDIWKMFAGIAFFLLAMSFMEEALRLLAGRSFKLFLKKQTSSRIKAVAGAVIVTGLLQSSSIVNLLVISLAGAGVVKMENALALILGSNLGSTFNSWLVVTLGFNFDIEKFVLPLIGIAGTGMAFMNRESKWFLWLKFIFSFALLFFALGYIKTGMEALVQQTDLSFFRQYPLIVFLLLGILLTAIVQSSSATIVLTLSALNAGAITFYIAMAIVLGSEIGTSLKLFLASAQGPAVKKRIAWGNFLFNFITVMIIFLLLRPAGHLITQVFKIHNNLVALVFFQSFINICSILIFLPFLKPFGIFLVKRFADSADESFYISKVSVADTGIALAALENETGHFIHHVIEYSLDSFGLEERIQNNTARHDSFLAKTVSEKYSYIKQLHGEMHIFYLRLQKTVMDKMETERLAQLIFAVRNCMYAAKNIRDAQHDIEQMRNSSNDVKYNFYLQSRERLFRFYQQVGELLDEKNGVDNYKKLSLLYQSVTAGYSETLQQLYKESLTNGVSEIEVTTLINFNRELSTSFKSILFGLKDYLLTPKEGEYFDSLPGFIR